MVTHYSSAGNQDPGLKPISPPFPPPTTSMHAHRKKTDLVEALHHHVRHVLIKHGGWYDDLIEGFVVPPQSWIGWLLLATAAQKQGGRKSVSRGGSRSTNTWTVCLNVDMEDVHTKLSPHLVHYLKKIVCRPEISCISVDFPRDDGLIAEQMFGHVTAGNNSCINDCCIPFANMLVQCYCYCDT